MNVEVIITQSPLSFSTYGDSAFTCGKFIAKQIADNLSQGVQGLVIFNGHRIYKFTYSPIGNDGHVEPMRYCGVNKHKDIELVRNLVPYAVYEQLVVKSK